MSDQNQERREGASGASRRIPSLDGLRAVSILAVLLGHLSGIQGLPDLRLQAVFGDFGNLGVRCFFVISGFLITHLLLQEAQASGRISLRDFYIRRTFRIFPAFYAYVLTVTALWFAGLLVLNPADLVYAAAYSINYVAQKSWVVGHIWSLAVEEQFYLLWPLCLVLIGWRKGRLIAFGALVLAPLLRIGTWYFLPEWRGIITKAFPTICDTIATGCVLACLRNELWQWQPYRRLLESRLILLVPLAVLGSNALASHTRPDFLVGHTIRNVGLAICIDWCVRNGRSPVGRLLNARFMVWMGTISYSLYLWQQLFLNRHSDAPVCRFPLNILLAFGFATLSYYCIEKPFLRARVRLFPSSAQPIGAPIKAASKSPQLQRADC